jgi:hypothetical protein
MSNRIFTVTLTDLGTYTATVCAGDETEARNIAKTMLLEEAITLPPALTIVKRDTEAKAEIDPAEEGSSTTFDVRATYSLDFEMTVLAKTHAEAERHARRLYQENCGPFEFDHCGDRVSEFRAREADA